MECHFTLKPAGKKDTKGLSMIYREQSQLKVVPRVVCGVWVAAEVLFCFCGNKEKVLQKDNDAVWKF